MHVSYEGEREPAPVALPPLQLLVVVSDKYIPGAYPWYREMVTIYSEIIIEINLSKGDRPTDTLCVALRQGFVPGGAHKPWDQAEALEA